MKVPLGLDLISVAGEVGAVELVAAVFVPAGLDAPEFDPEEFDPPEFNPEELDDPACDSGKGVGAGTSGVLATAEGLPAALPPTLVVLPTISVRPPVAVLLPTGNPW